MSLSVLFRVFRDGALLREVRPDGPVVKIGRIASAQVSLDDPTASRMHAVVEIGETEVVLIDLGSESGTYVNGARVNKANLRSGDEIRIGGSQILVTFEAPPRVAAKPRVAPKPPRVAPEPPRAGLECPRCRGAIAEIEESSGGGVYRERSVRALRCVPCAVTFLDLAQLAARLGRPDLRLSGSAADRGHTPTRSACPSCLASMNEVTLSWGGAWIVVEECPRCGMLALDEGEVEAMGQLAGETEQPEEAGLRALRGASSLLERLGSRQQ